MACKSPADSTSGLNTFPELHYCDRSTFAKTSGGRFKKNTVNQYHAPVPATTAAYDGSEAASNPRHQVFQGQFKKTLLCRFFESGHCRHSTDCSFAHGEEDLTIRPDLTKTSFCRAWLGGTCNLRPGLCPFAHGEDDLRVSPAFSKTRWDSRQHYKDTHSGRNRPITSGDFGSSGASSRSTMATCSDDASQATAEISSGDSLKATKRSPSAIPPRSPNRRVIIGNSLPAERPGNPTGFPLSIMCQMPRTIGVVG